MSFPKITLNKLLEFTVYAMLLHLALTYIRPLIPAAAAPITPNI